MNFDTRPRRVSAVNMTPLIDVVFLMLVFFLLTSQFIRYRSLELVLTGAPGPESISKARLLVRISDSGDLTLDGMPVNVNALRSLIAERIGEDSNDTVFVLTGPSVPLQRLVVVLEEVHASGATGVRIGALTD